MLSIASAKNSSPLNALITTEIAGELIGGTVMRLAATAIGEQASCEEQLEWGEPICGLHYDQSLQHLVELPIGD